MEKNTELTVHEETTVDVRPRRKGLRTMIAGAAAGLALTATAGCSSGSGDGFPLLPSASASSSETPTSTGSASTETGSPSPTNMSYPVGVNGCVENSSWTRSQEVTWMSGLVEYGAADADFVIAEATEKYANSGALCKPLEATAIFWHTENDSPIQLYRGDPRKVEIDGSHETTIESNAPSDAPDGASVPILHSCEGSARALYVGWEEVEDSEIPSYVPLTASSGSLYASQFKEASDRAVDGMLSCYGANPNNNSVPLPDYTYSVPTPDYSYLWPAPTYSY